MSGADNLFWLSFAGAPKPSGGSRFLYVAIIDAESVSEALSIAERLGCDPNAEVKGADVGRDHVPAAYLNRKLTWEECETLEAIMVRRMAN